MQPLQSNKQRAKQLFKNEQYPECKEVLLDMIQEGDGHYKLLMQLGNVCTSLNEYQNAKKYYQQSIKENPNYSLVYRQFAILLSEYLNEYDLATQMFEKCIQLNPNNNDVFWFNYGKLMYKIRNYDKAKQCYLKIQTETAGLHYHFAKLLLKINSNINDIQNAKLKLEKATEIKPDNAIYHYEYALCLQKLKQYKSANTQFIFALKLSNNKKIQILYDYSNLLSIHLNYHKQAIEYLKIAYELDTKNEYPHVKNRYFELKNPPTKSQKTINIETDNDFPIKLLVYGFDKNITYWPMNDININDIRNMTKLNVITKIFGGTDRINRLQQHFQRISSKDIQLAIISFNNAANIIIEILKKVNLYKYFSDVNIIGSDTTGNLQQHIYYIIMALTNRYKINISKQIVFIDSILENIQLTTQKCNTYYIKNELLNGLSLYNMYTIEKIIGVNIQNDCGYDLILEEKESYDLIHIDKVVYNAIKKEIIKQNCAVNELNVIKYINQTWKDDIIKQKFLYFAEKYKQIRQLKIKFNFWTISNILPHMIQLSPNDGEISSRYAACLALLQHYESADNYFKMSMKQIHSDVGIIYHNYAYFLLNRKQYSEAEIYFEKAIELSNTKYYFQSCLGYAKTLQYLKDISKSEIYYKQAIKCRYEIGKMQYFYGLFLFNNKRYLEAKIQFEIAVNYYPNTPTNHYWLSKTLQKLKEFKQSNHHSKIAVNLDPNLTETNAMIIPSNEYTFDSDERSVDATHISDRSSNDSLHSNSNTNTNTNSNSPKSTHSNSNSTANMFEKKGSYSNSPRPRNNCSYNGNNNRGYYARNPLFKYSENIDTFDMERYRNQMERIAINEYEIALDKLPNIYYKYCQHDIKSVYNGKMKNLAMYFHDIFQLKWNKDYNKIYLMSKLYRNKSIETPHKLTFSKRINPSKMEKYRWRLQIIAENEEKFHLSNLNVVWKRNFMENIKTVYQGKNKNLLIYFNDLFELKCNTNNKITYVISKIYRKCKFAPKHYNKYVPKKNINKNVNQMTTKDTITVVIPENCQVEFDRFWFDELGIINNKFNMYYDNFLRNYMNDIRCLLNENIESKLRYVLKINEIKDLQLIMKHIGKIRNENREFIKMLKQENLNKYYAMFTDNGIFTINILKCYIKSENDIKQMIDRYVLKRNNVDKFYDKDMLISFIWNLVNIDRSC